MEIETARHEFVYEKDYTIAWVKMSHYFREVGESLQFSKYDFASKNNILIPSFEERISQTSDIWILYSHDTRRIGIKVPARISNDRIGSRIFLNLWKRLDKNLRMIKGIQDYLIQERNQVNSSDPPDILILSATPLSIILQMNIGKDRERDVINLTLSHISFQENIMDPCTRILEVGKKWLLNSKSFDEEFRKSKNIAQTFMEFRHLIAFSLALSDQYDQRYLWVNIVPLSLYEYYLMYKNHFKISIIVLNRMEKTLYGLRRPKEHLILELFSIQDDMRPIDQRFTDFKTANLDEFAKRLNNRDANQYTYYEKESCVNFIKVGVSHDELKEFFFEFIEFLAINYIINDIQNTILGSARKNPPKDIFTIVSPDPKYYVTVRALVANTYPFYIGFTLKQQQQQQQQSRQNPNPRSINIFEERPSLITPYIEYMNTILQNQPYDRKLNFIPYTYLYMHNDFSNPNSHPYNSLRRVLVELLPKYSKRNFLLGKQDDFPSIQIVRTGGNQYEKKNETEVIIFLNEHNKAKIGDKIVSVDDYIKDLQKN